ncbi:phosphotransferase family protein [Nonomuraea antimicrobica]
MLEYEPSDETLAAIASRHGTTAAQVRPLPAGVANRVFLLGDDLVLRIPRTKRFLPDLVKEAAVIPVALRAGVRTPRVVAFDDTCSVVDVPYMVLTRARGADLARLDLPPSDTDRVFRQAGRELAKLHRLSPDTTPALPAIPTDDDATDATDPWALTDRLLMEGWLDTETARWLSGWFDRLSKQLPASPPLVLVHGDLAPQNLLVSPKPAQLNGIVDWGTPNGPTLPSTSPRSPSPASRPCSTATGRRAAQARRPRRPGKPASCGATSPGHSGAWQTPSRARTYATGPPPASRLLALLRFFTSAPPAPWADLT